eukprot:PhM_4_TR16057/c0_g1_i1/m.98501
MPATAPLQPVKPHGVGRPISGVNALSPGPGTYDLNNYSPSKAVSMHTRLVDPAPYVTPGPGEYDVAEQRNMNAIPFVPKTQHQSAVLAKAAEKEALRGPATYFTDGTVHPHAIAAGSSPRKNNIPTLKGRNFPPDVAKTAPGPGEYSPTYNATDGVVRGPRMEAETKMIKVSHYNVPAPGAYNVGGGPNGRAMAFNSRDDDDGRGDTRRGVPGPGSYDVPSPQKNVHGTVIAPPRTSPQKSNKKKDVPGPGEYDIGTSLQSSRTPRFVAPSSDGNRRSGNDSVVGPGSYDIPSSVGTGRGVVIKDRSLGTSGGTGTLDVPGPGSYTVKAPSTAPSISFHRNTPHQTLVSKVLTDALYNVSRGFDVDLMDPKAVMKLKGPVMRARSNDSRKVAPKNTPGPGGYDVRRFGDDVVRNDRMFIPHTSVKRSVDNPGPGEYTHTIGTIEGKVGKKQTKPMRGGRTTCRAGVVPGPGAYNPTDLEKDSRSRTILNHTAKTTMSAAAAETFVTPGPGEYDLPSSEAPVTKFAPPPSHNNNNACANDRQSNVGPGTYSPRTDMTLATGTLPGPSFAGRNKTYESNMAKTPRESKPSLDPGPGAYTPRPPASAACGVRMSKDSDEAIAAKRVKDTFPGPGQYRVRGTFDESRFDDSKGTAMFRHADDAVPPRGIGPGEYEQRDDYIRPNVRGVKISGPVERDAHFKRSHTDPPGPGEYDVGSTIGHGRSVSVGMRHPSTSSTSRQRDNYPGPADYNPQDVRPAATGPKMVPGPEPKEPNAVLGPGEYTPRDTIVDKLSSKNHIGVSFKSRYSDTLREKQSRAMPGPADTPVTSNGFGSSPLKAIVTGRRTVRTDQERQPPPAPNAYEPSDSYTKTRKPQYSIGLRHEEAPNADAPGPGHYDVPSTMQMKGPIFGTSA